jgi:uncharacterized membrane protein
MAEEISWISVIIITLLTGVYSITNWLGTDTFDKCEEINKDEEKIKHKEFMKQSLIAVVTLASTLLIQKFLKSDGLIFAGILSIAGILASYYSYTIVNNDSCKAKTKKVEKEYIMYGSPTIFAFTCLIVLYLMTRKSNVE